MTETSKGKKVKTSNLPEASSLHEESISGLEVGKEVGKEVCQICGKAFRTHSELDRHVENVHGAPEKTHTRPHRVE